MDVRKIALAAVVMFVGAAAAAEEKSISISSDARFYDEKVIPSNIREECDALGLQFSESTQKHLEASGWKVQPDADVGSIQQGKTLKLQITNAVSSGNAFIGHHKNVSVSAELYEDGKLLDTFVGTRSSGGGFAGGFKGSCSVLYRCANTLGSDLSKWVNKKAK